MVHHSDHPSTIGGSGSERAEPLTGSKENLSWELSDIDPDKSLAEAEFNESDGRDSEDSVADPQFSVWGYSYSSPGGIKGHGP